MHPALERPTETGVTRGQPLRVGSAGFYLSASDAGYDAFNGLIVFSLRSKHGVLERPGHRNGRTWAGGQPLFSAND